MAGMTSQSEAVVPPEQQSRSSMVFTIDEYKVRYQRLKEGMAENGIDILFSTMPEQLNYITGFDPLGVYFYQGMVVAPDFSQPVLITHKCEKELARTQCWIDDVRVWQHQEDPIALTVTALREAGIKAGMRLGLEMGNWYLQPSWVERFRQELPGVQIVDATAMAMELRLIKSPAEIALMRRAAHLADVGFAAAVGSLRSGVSEFELNAAALEAMALQGSEYPALPMIIGSGERSGLFHGVPTGRRVSEGEPVMLEISGVASRYNSNIVRTVVCGKADATLQTLWSIVTESFWRPFELVRPGVPVAELDRLSREIRSEYADYIPARAGFGIGLAYPPVWLGRPDVLVGDPHILEPGMIFSLEPSIAQYGGASVIFGYNILVTETGAEILHKTDHELFEVM